MYISVSECALDLTCDLTNTESSTTGGGLEEVVSCTRRVGYDLASMPHDPVVTCILNRW